MKIQLLSKSEWITQINKNLPDNIRVVPNTPDIINGRYSAEARLIAENSEFRIFIHSLWGKITALYYEEDNLPPNEIREKLANAWRQNREENPVISRTPSKKIEIVTYLFHEKEQIVERKIIICCEDKQFAHEYLFSHPNEELQIEYPDKISERLFTGIICKVDDSFSAD